jgi:hypothetical protein
MTTTAQYLQYARVMKLDAEWDESAHPRAENGQFGEGNQTEAHTLLAGYPEVKLSALDHKDIALKVEGDGRIVGASIAKGGGKINGTGWSVVSLEHAREWLKDGTAYRLAAPKPAAPSAPRESKEAYTQRMADAGKTVQPADWSTAMNRDT